MDDNNKINLENENKIDLKFSIEKILKHLNKNYSKCINMLKSLLLNIRDLKNDLNILVIIKIFYNICKIPIKFVESNDRKTLEDIYDYITKEFERLEIFNFEESEILNLKQLFLLFKIPIKIQSNLITDDSFLFNGTLKKVEESYDTLYPLEAENIELQKFESLLNSDEIYNTSFMISSNKINMNELISEMKREYIFDCFRQAFLNHKVKWATTPITQLIKKAYYEKAKLSEIQLLELEKMINILKTKSNTTSSIDSHRSFYDEKIKTNPLESYYKVSDAREERIMEGEADSWVQKQCGLGSSSMKHISN